jgi:integral membrane sensor domain MASE1
MGKGTPAIVSVIVFVLLAFVALKLLGALIGFAVKVLLLAIAVASPPSCIWRSSKQIGGPRAP